MDPKLLSAKNLESLGYDRDALLRLLPDAAEIEKRDGSVSNYTLQKELGIDNKNATVLLQMCDNLGIMTSDKLRMQVAKDRLKNSIKEKFSKLFGG